jgi:hypothetical protein
MTLHKMPLEQKQTRMLTCHGTNVGNWGTHKVKSASAPFYERQSSPATRYVCSSMVQMYRPFVARVFIVKITAQDASRVGAHMLSKPCNIPADSAIFGISHLARERCSSGTESDGSLVLASSQNQLDHLLPVKTNVVMSFAAFQLTSRFSIYENRRQVLAGL